MRTKALRIVKYKQHFWNTSWQQQCVTKT